MPCRSAAAHPRQRHARPADPRQDRAWQVARSLGRWALHLRQCRDLGAGRIRLLRSPPARTRPVGVAGRPDQARGRAGGPQRGKHGDGNDGRSVRHRRDHWQGAATGQETGKARLHLQLRHARRSGDDDARCRSLLCRLRARDPRHRQGILGARRLCRAGNLDQAIRVASPVCPRAGGPGDGRASAQSPLAGRAGERL